MSITTWNRLECDVVFDDPARGLARGLTAELADPLWLLARQRQMGEFRGEEGGSLIHALVTSHAHPIASIAVAGRTMAFDGVTPLEAIVEREPASADMRLRIRGGEMLAELLVEHGLDRLRSVASGHYGFEPAGGDTDADESVLRSLLGTGSIDAERVRVAFEAGRLATELAVEGNESSGLDTVLTEWLAWYRPRAGVDAGGAARADAWLLDRLEHQFSVGVPTPAGTMVLNAPEYPGGRLDWDAFTVTGTEASPGTPQSRSLETLPLPVDIPGMPVVRYWEIEDPRFDAGRVSVGPGDATRLLMVEFALTFASDWFVVPVPVRVGALVGIPELVVTDTFGVVRRIRPAEQQRPDHSFALWRLTDESGLNAAADLLLVPPPPAGGLESDPIEDVALIRDELANLAWAIEVTVPALLGGGRSINRATPPRVPPSAPAPGEAGEAMVPERVYVPFPALPPDRVPLSRVDRPEGTWLARAQAVDERLLILPTEGRFLTPAFQVRDDEVGVDGIVMTRRFQLALGQDGVRHVWISRSKRPGASRAGERIAFDALAEPESK